MPSVSQSLYEQPQDGSYGRAPLRARVDEIEMDVAALYAEIEELLLVFVGRDP